MKYIESITWICKWSPGSPSISSCLEPTSVYIKRMIWFVKLVVHHHQSFTQKRSCLNQLLYQFCLAIANIEENSKVMFGLLKLHLLAFIYHRKQVWIGLSNRTCLRKRRSSVGVKQPSVQSERQSRCLACYRFLLDIYCIRKKIMILHYYISLNQ